ncbi:MAG: spore cortex biosynthesis protein YabQ [Eubacteriales bacterium]|nr:spore cortex biosynthesis protein YabQ [Eubacteriales bacterium]
MATLIYDEMELFFVCMSSGAMLAMVYDLVRILRLFFRHRDWVVDVEDLLFWIMTAWIVFRMLFAYNQGILRAYAFLGLLLGFLVYAFTLSKLLLFTAYKIVPYWKRGMKYVKKPFAFLLRWARKGLKNILTQVKMAIKSR